MERRYVPGLVLVVIGGVLLLARQQLLSGDLSVLVIGTVFLIAYAFTGHPGLLVPGGILTGLGAGIAARDRVAEGGATVLLGLGAGFLLIYLAEWARGGRRPGSWWPVIPGGILITIGLLQVARAEGMLTTLASWWPILLILLGVWLIARPRPTQ